MFGGYGDRSHIKVNSGVNQHSSYGDRSHIKVVNQQIRPPFWVIAHNEEKIQKDSAKESEGEQLFTNFFFLLLILETDVRMEHSEFLFC